MKSYAIFVTCLYVCFVGVLTAKPVTEEYEDEPLQYSLTPPEDYYSTQYEDYTIVTSPVKKTVSVESDVTETESDPTNLTTMDPTDDETDDEMPETKIPTTITSTDEISETTESELLSTEMAGTGTSAISPSTINTTKKSKSQPKTDGPESSMYLVRKGDDPEIIGLNIGLYYVLRDVNKKMENHEDISVKPLIRILALTEKISNLGGRVHPRNQDLIKKIYGETLKDVINT